MLSSVVFKVEQFIKNLLPSAYSASLPSPADAILMMIFILMFGCVCLFWLLPREAHRYDILNRLCGVNKHYLVIFSTYMMMFHIPDPKIFIASCTIHNVRLIVCPRLWWRVFKPCNETGVELKTTAPRGT